MSYIITSMTASVVEESPRITSACEAEEIFKKLVGDQMRIKEHFCIMTLDGSSRIIRAETVHVGTVNQSMVHPREVFRPALIDNAAGILVSHNHPSGTLEASRSDIQITQRLKEVAKLVGIELLDHIIITEDGYFSFSDEGIL